MNLIPDFKKITDGLRELRITTTQLQDPKTKSKAKSRGLLQCSKEDDLLFVTTTTTLNTKNIYSASTELIIDNIREYKILRVLKMIVNLANLLNGFAVAANSDI